jgi:hypothetical protein
MIVGNWRKSLACDTAHGLGLRIDAVDRAGIPSPSHDQPSMAVAGYVMCGVIAPGA